MAQSLHLSKNDAINVIHFYIQLFIINEPINLY